MTAPKKKPEPPAPTTEPMSVISTRWGVSIPIVVLIVTVVVSNLTMFFNMQSRTSVLGEQFKAVANDVTEIKGVLTKFTGETSAELRALRSENVNIRERFTAELTDLKVRLATLTANAADRGPK